MICLDSNACGMDFRISGIISCIRRACRLQAAPFSRSLPVFTAGDVAAHILLMSRRHLLSPASSTRAAIVGLSDFVPPSPLCKSGLFLPIITDRIAVSSEDAPLTA
jgi:hypothetical protein